MTDLDGTFVYDSHRVRPADQAAFKALQEYYYVGIATGRSLKEIAYIEQQNKLQADCKIAFNGATVINQRAQQLICQPLAYEDLQAVLRYLQQKNLTFDALNGEQRIGNFASTDVQRLWGMELITLKDPFMRVAQETIYKINVRPEVQRFESIAKDMKKRFKNLSLFESNGKRIEITAAGTSKGQALKLLQKSVALPIIGIGDSGNDLAMFQNSDLAICMNHATPKIKAQAKLTIDYFSDLLTYESKFDQLIKEADNV
ncbi:HAD-IIB family hydrolase [Bombilactobacillus bombi]|uniref:HAD-IIB family hydrolase n=1 Tax=Bombilactobacillus bombi TaxID=1303590 RepID=UPI001F0776AB|nr:HAD-IIB family hydrolase [Bombilactobacillus bombi]